MDGGTPEGAVSPWLVPVTLMPQYSLSAHEGPGEIAPPDQEALPVCRYPRCMSIPAAYPPRTRRVPMANAKSRSGLARGSAWDHLAFGIPTQVTAAGNPTPVPATTGSGLNLPNCHFGHYRLQCTAAR